MVPRKASHPEQFLGARTVPLAVSMLGSANRTVCVKEMCVARLRLTRGRDTVYWKNNEIPETLCDYLDVHKNNIARAFLTFLMSYW